MTSQIESTAISGPYNSTRSRAVNLTAQRSERPMPAPPRPGSIRSLALRESCRLERIEAVLRGVEATRTSEGAISIRACPDPVGQRREGQGAKRLDPVMVDFGRERKVNGIEADD